MTQNGRYTEEISPKQEQFIAALVTGIAIGAAAKSVGIGERTAYRWLALDHFQVAYKKARRRLFDERLKVLRDDIDLALSTLKTIMINPETDASVRVRAATVWLTQSIQSAKIEDLEARITELEEKQ